MICKIFHGDQWAFQHGVSSSYTYAKKLKKGKQRIIEQPHKFANILAHSMLSKTKLLQRIAPLRLNARNQTRYHGEWDDSAKHLPITFVLKNNEEKTVQVPMGTTVLEAAHHYNLPVEGACEGSLACSTCHVILDDDLFNHLEAPTLREEDLLDLAPGVTDTSRLCCQVKTDEELCKWAEAGKPIRMRLPKSTLNFYVDGHIPQTH